MSKYEKIVPPQGGKIKINKDKSVKAPVNPVIPFIEGNGSGPDIWAAAQRVIDAAVDEAYKGRRRIMWFELYAGQKRASLSGKGDLLDYDTVIKAILDFKVAIIGPLDRTADGAACSLKSILRRTLDLYQNIRPVRWFKGAPSPLANPKNIDVVIISNNSDANINSGSKKGAQRIARSAIKYAIVNKRSSVTIAHGENAFRDCCYEVARKEFPRQTIVKGDPRARVARSKIMVKDCSEESLLQHILQAPKEYDVIVTKSQDGGCVANALAAMVSCTEFATGASIGGKAAIFAANHDPASRYAGLDKVNPGSAILSGEMMLRHIGWGRAADLINKGFCAAIGKKFYTHEFARQIKGAKSIKCSQFGDAVIRNM